MPEHVIANLELASQSVIDVLLDRSRSNEILYDDCRSLLPQPVDTADPLFDAHRVPWKIKVHDDVSRLKIQSLPA